jgi:pantothenate kinase
MRTLWQAIQDPARKSLKMDLVEELLSLNDKEMLNRVKNYLKRLKKMEAEKADLQKQLDAERSKTWWQKLRGK